MVTSLPQPTSSGDCPATDLAGSFPDQFSWLTPAQRIHTLVERYVTLETLQERLQELPQQFMQPHPRPWKPIPWATIHPDHIRGIAPQTFCQILAGAINTESPIRGYTQASRQYLEHFYPQMARFVGGTLSPSGQLASLGLWEVEEKRHTPALLQLYTRLTGQKFTPVPHAARPYTPSGNPRTDLYRHGLHRIATEYGATCLYLWMMAHTTGPLQAVLEELLIDEINHMTKFWGFGVWAYPDTSLGKTMAILSQALIQKWRDRRTQGSLIHTLRRMMDELAWEHWSLNNRLTFLYTLDQVMRVLWQWHDRLTADELMGLFGRNFEGEEERGESGEREEGGCG